MRTIDADALKYAIVEEGQRSKRYKLGEFWELNGDEIWRVIDAQPTIETEPHWIPCSEKIPEDSGEYLTFQCSADIKYGWCQVLYYDDGWNCFGGNKKNEVKYVVAWMPLPKPWGGSEKDD